MGRKLILIVVLLLVAWTASVRAQEPVIFGAPNQGVITQNQVVNAPPAATVGFFLHIYAQTWSFVEPALTAISSQIATRLIAYVRGNMKTVIVVFLAVTLAGIMMRSLGEDWFMRWFPALIVIAIFTGFVITVPFYTNVIIAIWTKVPTSLIAAITGNAAAQNVPASLDISQAKSVLGATTILENISTGVLNPQTWVIAFMVVVLIVFSVLAHMIMFGCFVLLAFTGSLLIGIGPIALAFGPFPRTQSIMTNWLACLATTMLATGMLVASLVIIISIQTTLATQLLTLPAGGQGAFGMQIVGMAVAACVYIMFGWLAKQSIPLAAWIFSGVTGRVDAMIGAPGTAFRSIPGAAGSVGTPVTTGSTSASSSASSPPGQPIGRAA